MTPEEFAKTLELFGDASFAWGSAREALRPGYSDEEADEIYTFADFAEKKKKALLEAFAGLLQPIGAQA